MASNQDARPFVDLKKDAEEFRMKFDEDITECLNFLDAKITTLICDPDSFGASGRSIHQNALAEFSKAKYDIFIGVKSLINTKEREWLDYIAEMKKLFIENVEIFLAGTKLEVKLPPSESVSSRGSRKSPGNSKSNSASVSSSIYPILSSITKNIPVLGSSFQEKDVQPVQSKVLVGEKSQFNRRGRLSTSSIKLTNSPFSEEIDMEEPELDNSGRSRSRSSFNRSEKTTLNTSQPSTERRCSLKTENELAVAQNSMTSSDENESLTTEVAVKKVPLKGRRGRLVTTTKTNQVSAVAQNIKISSGENENLISEVSVKEVPLKGRRGRLATTTKTNQLSVVKVSSIDADEDENQTTGIIENEIPMKGRKGRSAPKAKINELPVAKVSSIDEDENQTTGIIENEIPVKGRRGRFAPKAKANELSVLKNSSSTDENENQPPEIVDKAPLKGRRGKSAPKTQVNGVTDQTFTQKTTARGRKTIHEAFDEEIYEPDQTFTQKTTARGRKTIHEAFDEEMYEPGPSKSPKKVPIGSDHSSSDELDIQTPLARPVKSAARRKTLLPNLEHLTGKDIIPGNLSHSKGKRKTISNASELETMVPAKRLKASQKTSSIQEDDSANDNLLESDGNYSEWISLKSVDGKIPTRPAVYEMKVWRAKKPAYIGSCENLCQKLTLYNLKQNSGHKQLDKFIDRNYNDIQVRYEVIPSFNDAKKEVKARIENFKAVHNNPPAYN